MIAVYPHDGGMAHEVHKMLRTDGCGQIARSAGKLSTDVDACTALYHLR